LVKEVVAGERDWDRSSAGWAKEKAKEKEKTKVSTAMTTAERTPIRGKIMAKRHTEVTENHKRSYVFEENGDSPTRFNTAPFTNEERPIYVDQMVQTSPEDSSNL
jgi:hypothetical protein